MQHFTDVFQAQKLCECLAAPARVEILRLVISRRADSLDALAKELHLTNGAITQHVKKLCEAGLIKLVETPGKRGIAKRCIPITDRVIIDIATNLERENELSFDVPVGAFSSATVKPYCGIASTSGWIGERDDPRYFTYPERINAALIYFNSGKISWAVPEPVKKGRLVSLTVSLEISSKPYGHGRSREAEVSFYLNDIKLGTHVIDGEFTDRKGLFTPSEFDGMCQYGKLKTIRIDGSGTHFDGIKIGDSVLTDFAGSGLTFSISTESGIAVFGSGYGDYDCGIKFKAEFE